MIIVNLKGGLGNQMFQYALGRHLAVKNHTELKLTTKTLTAATAVGDIHRDFGLDAFALEQTMATDAEVATLKKPDNCFTTLTNAFATRILRRTTVTFAPKVLAQTGDIYLDGYWQSPLFFNDIRPTLLKDFSLRDPLPDSGAAFASNMDSCQSVSVHVRRGDYASNPRVLKEFGVCSVAYYQSAIAAIRTRFPDAVFFVFSDDMEWVKRELPVGEGAVYVKHADISDAQEMVLMSTCKHNIIANSSFSWWGAWLNQNPDKIVVAPTPWFETATFDAHLIPSEWKQLPKN